MNIKQRINKIETRADSSGFCGCKETRFCETYRQDLTSDAETTEPVPMSEPVPDFCPRCGRAVDKKIIIVQFVESKIPKPEEAA